MAQVQNLRRRDTADDLARSWNSAIARFEHVDPILRVVETHHSELGAVHVATCLNRLAKCAQTP